MADVWKCISIQVLMPERRGVLRCIIGLQNLYKNHHYFLNKYVLIRPIPRVRISKLDINIRWSLKTDTSAIWSLKEWGEYFVATELLDWKYRCSS